MRELYGDWRDVLKSFRIALDPRKITLAVAGILLSTILVLGVLFGVMGNGGFGLLQILAVVVGVAIILCGAKGTKSCKCCNK